MRERKKIAVNLVLFLYSKLRGLEENLRKRGGFVGKGEGMKSDGFILESGRPIESGPFSHVM
jgi:hypothetical protein